MTDGQWMVLSMLIVLFSLEAVRVPAVYNWLVTALNQISTAISGNAKK